jgi:uncharacterized protein (TIGR03435 family)
LNRRKGAGVNSCKEVAIAKDLPEARMNVFKRVLFVFALPTCIGMAVQARMLSRPQVATAPLKFEVASVKPSLPDTRQSLGCHSVDVSRTTIPLGRCIFRHANLRTIIKQAYPLSIIGVSLLQERVLGGPAWIDGSPFDVEAKAEDPSTTTIDQLRQMLRTLLKERFQLSFHMETRQTSGYYMTPTKDGFKLKESTGPLSSADYAAATRRSGGRPLVANNMTLTDYADLLSINVKAPVVDKTNIPGKYNIFLFSAETGDETSGSIFSALQEQLGLKLEPQKISFEIYVIDHAEKPSEVDR